MTRSHVLILSSVLVGVLAVPRTQGTSATAATEVPIGGIILWWGRAADIPEGFEVCDGTSVTTKGAVLRGAKPNLESKFPRGAAAFRNFVPLAFTGGGTDTIDLGSGAVGASIEDHLLTANQLPSHQHAVGPLSHNVLNSSGGPNDPKNPPSLAHGHTAGALEGGRIVDHDHGFDHVHNVDDHTHGGVPSVPVIDGTEKKGTEKETFDFVESVTIGPTTGVTDLVSGGSFRTASPLDPVSFKADDTTDATGLVTSRDGGSIAAHPATTTGLEGKSTPIHLAHTVSVTGAQLDNRPAFLDVVFLIRVK